MDLWLILTITLIIAAIAFGLLIYYITEARKRLRLKFKAELDDSQKRERLVNRYMKLTHKMGIPPPKFDFNKYTTDDIKNAVTDLETEASKRRVCIKCGAYLDVDVKKCWKCGIKAKR